MNSGNRISRSIDQPIPATHIYVAFGRKQIDVEPHGHDSRLRQMLVLFVLALVVDALALGIVARAVAVENIGVVEDEAADAEDEGDCCRGADELRPSDTSPRQA